MLPTNEQFFNLLQIYDLCHNIIKSKKKFAGSSDGLNANSVNSTATSSASWEHMIYYKIGEFMKQNNSTIEATFKLIDQDGS